MSYKVEQKIGNFIYIYEAESYWDSDKKQSRQRRKYIGKKDLKTGELVTPRKSNKPKLSKDYGAVYLLEHLSQQLGLVKILKKHFTDDYENILALSYYMIIEKQALYLYKDWVDSTYIKSDVQMMPKKISSFLHTLSNDEISRNSFLTSWAKNYGSDGAVIFDITSLSSYGVLNEEVEWGYNRDGENLPQINLGVVYSDKKKLPLLYKTYQGSIKDVSTLKNIGLEVSSKGISNVLFVLDRGFYSTGNIKEVIKNKFGFIISGPNSSNDVNNLIYKHKNNIVDSDRAFLLGKEVVHHILDSIQVGEHDLKAHIYYSDKRKADEYDHFMRVLLEVEAAAKLKEFKNAEEAEEYLKSCVAGVRKYFTTEENSTVITRNTKVIKKRLDRMGIMILLSNTDENKFEILDLYKRRDRIEKLFDNLKNDLHGNRIRVHTKDSMDGLLFIKFISLILYSHLINIMKEKELNKKYSVRGLIQELKKLKKVEMTNGASYTTEISKEQKDILNAFAVPIPL